MSRELKKVEKCCDVAEKVVVAVKASKDVPKTALVWALTHVVQPGDCITLLVVFSSHASGRKLWSFPRFAGDCASGHKGRAHSTGSSAEQKSDITDSCSQMILQLHDVYDPNKINVKIKVVSGTPCGAVAAEAKKIQANWVVLDKHLKHEEKRCLEELQCNIVVMKRTQPKVLRLNLVSSSRNEPEPTTSLQTNPSSEKRGTPKGSPNPARGPLVTPSSSPETFTATDVGTSSVSSSDPGTSPFVITTGPKDDLITKKEKLISIKQEHDHDSSDSDTDIESLSSSSSLRFPEKILVKQKNSIISTNALFEKNAKFDDDLLGFRSPSYRLNSNFSGSLREAISLSKAGPCGPPPLCSICQHKTPMFGKPPRWFAYAELELATGGFSRANFLAEGGYGSVHRGVLPDGQAIAVKQHKLASSQGDQEFCSEVEVLSCAQHRNVVMLIGFCIEDGRRLLVYEYICNGSLDSHLYGRHQDTLSWAARQKIAVGAARGLRYLHEECRVGCIVHRDMRPNNILITHDFEPLVGDFGLARWQPDGEKGVETRVIGTFGYLAPEYAQSGQITEKADVYSFGVVLVELVTGRKAVDLNRPKGQQCLTEWVLRVLEGDSMDSGQLGTPEEQPGRHHRDEDDERDRVPEEAEEQDAEDNDGVVHPEVAEVLSDTRRRLASGSREAEAAAVEHLAPRAAGAEACLDAVLGTRDVLEVGRGAGGGGRRDGAVRRHFPAADMTYEEFGRGLEREIFLIELNDNCVKWKLRRKGGHVKEGAWGPNDIE
ncbi:Protein kinase protein with adenine nucleotide alpha hydrolases-like domain [Striga hermonthica]|uniref:Protein kinase protein with adenine nucleotide alpha hydrolases-like domain n=1 Tax=Striga hermonthica TaxID=68872 RepID=A0A9N7MTD5_STRHE|nr:Protein kinase protein with adenine nucleotide alpha hydrolases-like domain [Striga hermonthica]